MMEQPKFYTSIWYNKKTGKLKPGAPKSLVSEYNRYQKTINDNKKKGILV